RRWTSPLASYAHVTAVDGEFGCLASQSVRQVRVDLARTKRTAVRTADTEQVPRALEINREEGVEDCCHKDGASGMRLEELVECPRLGWRSERRPERLPLPDRLAELLGEFHEGVRAAELG